jgi:mycoredoxin
MSVSRRVLKGDLDRVGHVLRIWAIPAVFVCSIGSAMPGLSEEPAAQPTRPAYVVVLKDASTIPAKAKPLSAFGTFRFVDTTGHTVVLPVSEVDLDATRAANADVPDDPTRGTLSVATGAVNPPPVLANGGEDADEPAAPASITVYSATWCGYCTQLKRYLETRKIPATIIEVDRLPRDRQGTVQATMRQLTGRVAYPTVVIDGEAIAGFSQGWIESRIER